MSSVSALLGAASRLASAGRRGDLWPSVPADGGVRGVPAEATLLVGGDEPALAADPVLAGWFARMTGALTGDDAIDLSAPGRLGAAPVWAVLGHGDGPFDPSVLAGAVPAGTAWIVVFHPDKFFAQAADRLEARGDDRSGAMAAKLRTPTGNLALLGRTVRTAAISLEAGAPGALRLRLCCPDGSATRQTMLLLHAWRLRRGMRDTSDAAVFRASDLVRDETRVELTLPGDTNTLMGLFARR